MFSAYSIRIFLKISILFLTFLNRGLAQTTQNYSDAVNIYQSRANEARKKFTDILEAFTSKTYHFQTIDLEKSFIEYKENCEKIRSEVKEQQVILAREDKNIIGKQISSKYKKELRKNLSNGLRKLERIEKGLDRTIQYLSISSVSEWKIIHASFLTISGEQEANKKIAKEIESFIGNLPTVSSEGFKIFKFPWWLWAGLALAALVMIGILDDNTKAGGEAGCMVFLFVIGVTFACWLLNLLWRLFLYLSGT